MDLFKPNIFVSEMEARLNRVWQGSLSLRYKDEDCSLSVSGKTTFLSGVELVYDWAGEEIHLFFLGQNVCEFLDPELKGLDLADLPEDVRLLILPAFQNVIKDLFDGWEILVPKSFAFFANSKQLSLGFILRNTEKTLCQMGIEGDKPSEKFFNNLVRKNKSLPLWKTNKVSFPFRKEEGNLSLSPEVYKTLRCGDVLLNQHPYLRFHYGHVNFLAEKNGNIVTVKGEIMEEKDDLPAGIIPDEVEPAQEQSEGEEVAESAVDVNKGATDEKCVSLEQLPVLITFDTGSQNLTLEQVKQLHEGYIFELDKKTDDLVNILANGQCIGQGEWVQVEDHLGVRITHLR